MKVWGGHEKEKVWVIVYKGPDSMGCHPYGADRCIVLFAAVFQLCL